MALIISSPEQDPFANKHQLLQCRETIEEGVHYQARKYKIELTHADQFLYGCFALLCTVTLAPIFFMGLKNYNRLWKTCLSGLDRKIVKVACQTSSDISNMPYKKMLEFQKADKQEVLDLQEFVQKTNPNHTIINLNELEDLLPTDKLTLDGVTYYCSKPFKMDTHTGVLALIKIDDKVYPRIFYSSLSQGTWRCMPFAGKYEGFVVHYGKGIAENDTQLPIALGLLLQKHNLKNATYPNTFSYSTALKTTFSPNKTYLDQVRIKPFIEIKEGYASHFIDMKKCARIPYPEKPEALKMPEECKLPNFVALLEKREIFLQEYGKVKVKIFPSKDNSLHYVFYETEDKRVFIANIESVSNNSINTYGLREEALELHNLDAALLQYPDQIIPHYKPKAPNANRYQSTKYMNNWNYISEFDIIKEYYTSQKKPIPPKL